MIVFHKRSITYLFYLLAIFIAPSAYAQLQSIPAFDIKKAAPTSPEMALLSRFGDIPIGYYTGTANISVPIYNIKIDKFELPITLNYHSSGVKVDDQATNVGLGWSLEPGGAIIQQVNGRPDELDHLVTQYPIEYPRLKSGIMATEYGGKSEYGSSLGTGAWPCVSGGTAPNIDTREFLDDLLRGNGQPDIYQYNFGQFSGKFYINPENNQPVLIDKTNEIQFLKAAGNQEEWTAIVPDGTKYIFGAFEQSYTSNFDKVGAAWKLLRIELTSGKKIWFEYASGYHQWFSYSETYHSPFSFNIGAGSELGFNFTRTIHETKYLKRIVTDRVTINFIVDDRMDMIGREDMDNDASNGTLSVKKIKQIDLRELGSEKLVKTYKFNQSYFSYSTVGGGHVVDIQGITPDILGKRLKLNSIQEFSYAINGTEVALPPYNFEYNESVQLPQKNSFAKDFWGYFNGKDNSKLLPDLKFFFYSGYPEYQQLPTYLLNIYQGADRTTDPQYLTAYMLKKVTYPTGGYTEFEYNPNSFSNYVYPDVTKIQESLHNVNLISRNIPGSTENAVQFQLSRTMTVEFTNTINRGPNQSLTFDQVKGSTIAIIKTQPSFSIMKVWQMPDNNDARVDFNADGVFQWKENFTFNYEPGAVYRVVTTLDGSLGPQNTSQNSASSSSQFTYYDFNTNSGTFMSSYGCGVRISSLKNFDAGGRQISEKRINYAPDGNSTGKIMSPLNFLAPRYMNYIQLNSYGDCNFTFSQGSGWAWYISSDSSIPYSYAATGSLIGYSKVEEKDYGINSEQNGSRYYFYHNVESRTQIGMPDIPFPLNGRLQKEVIVNNVNDTLQVKAFQYAADAFATFSGVKIFNNFAGTEPCNTGPCGMWGNEQVWTTLKRYAINFYPIISNNIYLKGQETKQYNQGQIVSDKQTFEYNAHGLLKRSIARNSKDEEVATENTYPIDVSQPSPLMLEMLNRHEYDRLLEQRSFVETRQVSAAKTTFDIFNGHIVTKLIERSVGSADPFTEVEFTKYGNVNNLKELIFKGIPYSYLWSPDERDQIAYVSGAKLEQTFYHNFEYGDGNISGRTGLKGYAGTYLQTLYNIPDGAYILAYWKQNTAGSWVYNTSTVQVQNNSYAISIPGTVDDVALYPVNTQLVMYSYDSIGKLTSQTDAKGQTTYYEYDSFQRLKYVKDKNGNILKQYDYHYQNQ